MKKNTKQTSKKITVVFGYGLFTLTIVGVIFTIVIPYTSLLLGAYVRHLNVVMILIAFISAAILPALISYVIGDRATHRKNKLTHHFNGVLFGFGAYWLSILGVSWFVSAFIEPLRALWPGYEVLVVNVVPVLLIILVMLGVAISYVRHQSKKDSVLEHRPYQVVLVGAFLATLVSIIVSQVFVWNTGLFQTLAALAYVLVSLGMVGISYKFIKNQSSTSARLTASVVAVSIAFITATTVSQLISPIFFDMLTPIITGLVAWILYLVLVTRRG